MDRSTYLIPVYDLTTEGLKKDEGNFKTIQFVQGPVGSETHQSGIITEDLLTMLIGHLNTLNKPGPLYNEHTAQAVSHLEQAILCIVERKHDRKRRGVFGTMNK